MSLLATRNEFGFPRPTSMIYESKTEESPNYYSGQHLSRIDSKLDAASVKFKSCTEVHLLYQTNQVSRKHKKYGGKRLRNTSFAEQIENSGKSNFQHLNSDFRNFSRTSCKGITKALEENIQPAPNKLLMIICTDMSWHEKELDKKSELPPPTSQIISVFP